MNIEKNDTDWQRKELDEYGTRGSSMRYYIYHYSADAIVKESGVAKQCSGLIPTKKITIGDYTELVHLISEQVSGCVGSKCENILIGSFSYLGRESWLDCIKRILKTNKQED